MLTMQWKPVMSPLCSELSRGCFHLRVEVKVTGTIDIWTRWFFCWGGGRDYLCITGCLVAFLASTHEMPAEPPFLVWSHVSCRTESSRVENHCFLGIQSSMFCVLDLSYYSFLPSFHVSSIGCLPVSWTPQSACAHPGALDVRSFWNVLPNSHMAPNTLVDIFNLSCVMSAFPR